MSKEDNTEHWQNYFKARDLSSQAPDYIREAEKIIEYHNLSQKERDIVETISKREAIKQAELSTAKRLGIEEGLQRGKVEIIRSMIRAGYSYEQINEISPLSREEYDDLKKSLKA